MELRSYAAAVAYAHDGTSIGADMGEVEQVDARGELTQNIAADSEHGAIKTKLTVTRTSAGQYRREGTRDGQEERTTFAFKTPMTVTLAQRAKLRALATAGRGELRFFVYSSFDTPMGPVEKNYRAEADGRLLLTRGTRESRVRLDAQGLLMEEVELNAPIPLTRRRIFERGAL